MQKLRVLLAFAVLVSAGCAAERSEPGIVARDSAGISIIENQTPLWTAPEQWAVDPAPLVEIGLEEGTDPYLLYRVFDALRLSDGRIVIGNAGSGELRFFDASGRFLSLTGRHGGGPGEFGEFSSMRVCPLLGGRITVEDGANARVNVFSTEGKFLTTVLVAPLPEARPPGVMDCFGDGTWLTILSAGSLQQNPGTVVQGTIQYHRYNEDGTAAGRLVQLAARPRFVNQVDGITNYPFIPLTAEPLAAAGPDRAYVVPSGSAVIERRTLDGALDALIRWPTEGRHRASDIYERFAAAALAEMEDSDRQRQYAHLYQQDLPLPDSAPALQSVMLDQEGNLWAERYRLPWDTIPRWEVFALNGRWLGTVETPYRLRIFQIGGAFILGRHLDELGVERVRMHALRR